jgi:hypothetical protein
MTRELGWQSRRHGRAGLRGSVALAVLVLVGCSDRQATEASRSTLRSEAVTTAAPAPETPETVVPPATQLVPEIPGTGTSGPAVYAPAQHDPLIGEAPRPMLTFDAGGAYRLDENGFARIADGPIAELADDGAGGILFQREQRDRVIWWLPAGATAAQELLVTEEASYLVLEGVVGSGTTRSVVYQRAIEGGPDTSETTLRMFDLASRDVSEVTVTGGFEQGTRITSIVGGFAAGTWSAEATSGYFLYDLTLGQPLLGPDTGAASGQIDLRDHVTVHDDGLLAIGLASSQAGGEADQVVLFRMDRSATSREPIAALPWQSGYWYPSGLYVDDQIAVISRSAAVADDTGSPQGPIVVDLASGQPATLPFAANARPVSGA